MRLRSLLLLLVVAILVTWPVITDPRDLLIGDPRIDVWNHAWGYWWVAEALSRGELPYETELAGAPEGGVLYFIDLWGALWASPLTLLLGPAVAYNLTLLLRVMVAGLGPMLLSEELAGRGPHRWLAGVAGATTPFLVVELENGISEVTGVGWIGMALWATARALRLDRPRDWLLAGLLTGWTAAVSFYYGFVGGLLVGLLVLHGLHTRWQAAPEQRWKAAVRRLGLLGLPALVLALPFWLLFRASLDHPRALVQRPPSLDIALMRHNAVDPRVFVAPGDFASVDLLRIYGEPFTHTGYLRWSVLLLAVFGIWSTFRRADRRLLPWLGLMVLSLLLGMGSYLWWNGEWVTVGGRLISLPFSWLRMLLPQVAITHPLRLSAGAQVIAPALAAVGLAELLARLPPRPWKLALVPAFSGVIAIEGLLGSAAEWPLPMSLASVPELYRRAPAGLVLELPVEAGTTMETSRWFWHQPVHKRPVPWTPDVRMGSVGDPELIKIFANGDPSGRPAREQPRPLREDEVRHLRETYGMIVLHLELADRRGLRSGYQLALTRAFGPPERYGDRLVWWPGGPPPPAGE